MNLTANAHGRKAAAATSSRAAVLWRRAMVAGILALALAARLREPLSSPIIGAEDPYLHMARTWDLLQGRGLPQSYPPGFAILLAPFALAGPSVFEAVVRFLPPLLGVVEVLGVYLLCREHLRTPAAVVAAMLVALMPENVFRTNLLFPTALDLALLPFYLLFLLRAGRGDLRALAATLGLALVMLAVHPWVIPFLAAPTLVVAFRAIRARNRALALGALGIVAAGAAVFAFVPATWNPAPAFLRHAGPRAMELLTNPASLFPLPIHVDLPAMLSWTAIVLGAVGAAAALVRRTTLGLAALAFTAAILPFVFVDWFDVWFIPHRSVAYLSLGIAILAALPIELMGALPDWSMGDVAAAAVVGAFLLFTLAPVGLNVAPWYRLYDEDDQEAWRSLDDRNPDLVVTGSWEAAVGYRALTGEDAVFNPEFFTDAGTRAHDLRNEPDTVVLVDRHARNDGVDTSWLKGWKKVGEWGASTAYAPP